jgi:hypothetical protein
MHTIYLSPFQGPAPLEVSVQGDAITINGTVLDFGPLAEGASLPAAATGTEFFEAGSTIDRVDGGLVMTLLLPFGANAPEATRFPSPITVTGDGPVTLPPYSVKPQVQGSWDGENWRDLEVK